MLNNWGGAIWLFLKKKNMEEKDFLHKIVFNFFLLFLHKELGACSFLRLLSPLMVRDMEFVVLMARTIPSIANSKIKTYWSIALSCSCVMWYKRVFSYKYQSILSKTTFVPRDFCTTNIISLYLN